MVRGISLVSVLSSSPSPACFFPPSKLDSVYRATLAGAPFLSPNHTATAGSLAGGTGLVDVVPSDRADGEER